MGATHILAMDTSADRFRICTDRAVPWHHFYMMAPPRLVLDVSNVQEIEAKQWAGALPEWASSVRLGYHSGQVQRFVFDLLRVEGIQIRPESLSSGQWCLLVFSTLAQVQARPSVPPPPPRRLNLNLYTNKHDELLDAMDGQKETADTKATQPSATSAKSRISKALKSKVDLGYGFDLGLHNYQKNIQKRSRDLGVSNRFGDVDLTVTVTKPGVELGTELGDMDLNLRMGEQDGEAGVLLRFGGDW